jgi:hypothetical protein
MEAGCDPSTLVWRKKCSTTVLLQLTNNNLTHTLRHFHFPGESSGGWIQTLNLGMVKQGFYHCAIATDQHEIKSYLIFIFSLLVPATVAGLKPLTLVWGSKFSTTVRLKPN